MSDSAEVSYEFGSFHLNPRERWLLVDGRPLSLTPKAFLTLVALVERGGQLIDKQELMDRLWPDAVVEEGTLARNISDLRRVLGEGPGERKYIETVPKRGYRFVAPVRVIASSPVTSPPGLVTAPASAIRAAHQFFTAWYGILSLTALAAALVVVGTSRGAAPAPAAQPVRSIAVAPFRLLENGPGDRFLGVGLADEIIARLNPLHSLVVRSVNAVQFDALTRDIVDYGRALGVEAVLDGSIQRSGEHLRVTADLVRVSDRTSIWAGQFDETSTDLLTIEDSISAKVVDALVLALSLGSGPHALRKTRMDRLHPLFAACPDSLRRSQCECPDGRRGVDAGGGRKRTAVDDEQVGEQKGLPVNVSFSNGSSKTPSTNRLG